MTVSYTCQKPIKFWAKCKINLLYKLNQPFCVFQAALSSWQQGSGLGPHSSWPWSSTSLFIHKTIPSQSMSCRIYWSPFGLLFPKLSCRSHHGSFSEVPGSPSPGHGLSALLPLPLFVICWEPLCSSSCLLPSFFPGSDSILFLFKPSMSIRCLIF